MLGVNVVDQSASSEDKRLEIASLIRSRLVEYNLSHYPDTEIQPVIFSVEKGTEIVGGLIGRIAWDWLHIELLWLHETLRSRGLGRKLVERAEEMASLHDCTGVFLDTFSFQAPDFYISLGYEVFGSLDNFPSGASRYFLKKYFTQEQH